MMRSVKMPIAPLEGPLSARSHVPGSRSMTNRALLLAALSDGESTIRDMLRSEDTEVFVAGLETLGYDVSVDWQALTCRVRGQGGALRCDRARVWTENAGTAARFLLALCAASHGVFEVDGTAQIRRRPVGPLVGALTRLGARFEPSNAEHLPLSVHGAGLAGGFAGDTGNEKSSQFLSAVLMVAPLAREDVEVDLAGVISRPFVEMTTGMMRRFGVETERLSDDRLRIRAPQRYAATNFAVEPDASTASYFLAAAAISGGTIELPGLLPSRTLQGDVAFVEVLAEMGCTWDETSSGLRLTGPKTLRAVRVDMNRISDTFMTLAALAPFADGTTRIEGLAHTRLQESDRLTAMEDGLRRMGVAVRTGPDWIEIDGGSPTGAEVSGFGDHRIAMSLAIMGLRVPGVVIDGAECVKKTCPDYYERIAHLASGGDARR